MYSAGSSGSPPSSDRMQAGAEPREDVLAADNELRIGLPGSISHSTGSQHISPLIAISIYQKKEVYIYIYDMYVYIYNTIFVYMFDI